MPRKSTHEDDAPPVDLKRIKKQSFVNEHYVLERNTRKWASVTM